MAKIRDLGINFIPGASRHEVEITPLLMGDAAGYDDEKERGCGGSAQNCSLTDDGECGDPRNPCSLTDDEDDCAAAGPNCSLTDDDDCEARKTCSLTDDEEDREKKSTKGLSTRDVALLTRQLENRLAGELEN